MPTGQEVRKYLLSACEHFRILDKIQLNTEITSLRWLEDEAQWELTVSHLVAGVGDMPTAERKAAIESSGLQSVVLEVEVIRAKVVVSAVGGLVEPKGIPNIPGRDSFQGRILHTARWDDTVEIEGKDIVVVGTGATGAQITPALVEKGAKSVTQVMRSPPWVTPGMTPEAAAGWAKWMPSLCAYVPGLQWSLRKIIFTQFEMEFSALFKATETSRKKRQKKGTELVDYLHTATPDKYHDMLTPNYEVFCKRRVMDTAWFRSLHDDKVDLTTLSLNKIHEKTVTLGQAPTDLPAEAEKSAETKTIPADIIVFANGYETGKWLHPIEVVGRDGRSLSQTWKDRGGPQAYLGTAVDGFPNFFMIAGPNTFSGHSSVILASENSVAYVLKIIRPILEGDAEAVEVKEAAERQYTMEVQETLKKSVWTSGGCSSYYYTADGWNSFLYP
jgi:cation diffusion facilitator CzcD-associated flavoprotein CzcO